MYSKDIAKLAGVSRSTVSRVVNNYSNVQPETREKVNKIIKKYGYIPHAPARALAGKVSNIIGIFIASIKLINEKFRVYQNVYISPFEAAIIDYEKKQGRKAQNYIIVNSDNYSGAYKAPKHLMDYGHPTIAHICGDMNKYSGFKRLEGYKKAMNEAKLKIKEDYVVYGDFTEDSGFKCVNQLFKKGSKNQITAIFSSNDTMAIGAMKALKKMNLKIPKDISIVGYDDIRIASYVSPALTTVKSPILEIASVVTSNLINFIENNNNSDGYYTVPAELIIRESTKK